MACLSQAVSFPAALARRKFLSLSFHSFIPLWFYGTNPLLISKKTLKAAWPCKASLGLITFSEHRADSLCVRESHKCKIHFCVRPILAFLCRCARRSADVCANAFAACVSSESRASSEPQCVLFSRVPGLKCNFIQSRKLGFLLY